jgi:hypothetical protein
MEELEFNFGIDSSGIEPEVLYKDFLFYAQHNTCRHHNGANAIKVSVLQFSFHGLLLLSNSRYTVSGPILPEYDIPAELVFIGFSIK